VKREKIHFQESRVLRQLEIPEKKEVLMFKPTKIYNRSKSIMCILKAILLCQH